MRVRTRVRTLEERAEGDDITRLRELERGTVRVRGRVRRVAVSDDGDDTT